MPYLKMSEVNPSLKGIKPPVTLAQANAIAAIADAIPEDDVESPWAVAVSKFKEGHVVKDGKWVKKEDSDFGKKEWIGDVAAAFMGALKQLVNRGVDVCVCPKCGKEYSHTKGVPCTQETCSKCNVSLVGKSESMSKKVSTETGASRDSETGSNKEIHTGVKAIERDGNQYIALWTANAFRDREQEIFSTKALEDYVARSDAVNAKGRVWFWHVKGSDFADIVWQGVQGRILVEVAKIDDTDYGHKMFDALEHPEQFSDLLPNGWGTSHGYLYRAKDKQDGVYSFMHKFESTVLPLHRASNWFGGIKQLLDTGGDIMGKVTAEKAAGLAALVGEEMARQLLVQAAKATDGLEGLVDFKEDGDGEEDGEGKKKKKKAPPAFPFKKKAPPVAPDDEDEEDDDEEEGDEDGAKEADDNLFEVELTDELLKEIAVHVSVEEAVEKAVKEILPAALKSYRDEVVKAVGEAVAQATIASKEAVVQEALAGKMRLTPYVASGDADNIVPKGAIEEAAKEGDDASVVSAVVQRMLAGR